MEPKCFELWRWREPYNPGHKTYTILTPPFLNCLGSATGIINDFHNKTVEAHANKCETAMWSFMEMAQYSAVASL